MKQRQTQNMRHFEQEFVELGAEGEELTFLQCAWRAPRARGGVEGKRGMLAVHASFGSGMLWMHARSQVTDAARWKRSLWRRHSPLLRDCSAAAHKLPS